jgi:hypothetical protein
VIKLSAEIFCANFILRFFYQPLKSPKVPEDKMIVLGSAFTNLEKHKEASKHLNRSYCLVKLIANFLNYSSYFMML